MMMQSLFDVVRQAPAMQVWGKVTNIVGVLVQGYCPNVSVGSLCEIVPEGGESPVQAEVVGFRDAMALLMPLGELRGLAPGNLIKVLDSSATLPVGEDMLGRVLDAMGYPIDGKGPLSLPRSRMIYAQPPGPMERAQISVPLDVGVSSINGLLTCGLGQRLAIMAGSGVGKSTLMGMIARDSKASINVIALIGERGREVREFIENDLGPEGLKRSVVIVATSDQSPVLRMRGAFAATAVAEHFADQGEDVMLIMDSVTRYAMANREIGLAVGEPPTTKGYPPSVFAKLPKFLERAGNFKKGGSITGLYTVLVEGDDMNEPVADTVRSILDGHIVLDRRLANKNHYPPIDVLQSASRLMRQVVDEEHLQYSAQIQNVLATYRESEDLVTIGAYTPGTNRALDDALNRIESVNEFLTQDKDEHVSLEETRAVMQQVCS
ncbi:FliI/YscN family ATPase [Desulfohalobium retbaense]|uniref:Flagellar protein export ATPase FliI n=1 Tax=Desulfohalobium retbaense (strain ATCC 49708 / DSM 5692 / JCM 16813 / HR100) TaxID=485915 RepID=C8WYV3_DESRD|nr:FliI/YscN family ATPase [Desulfohalobium retbaense]ACV67869.1 flagellar protein export ATPase FliI [Desulfohalobium retbaense DSM 5692]